MNKYLMISIFVIKMDNVCFCFCYICCVLELISLYEYVVYVLIDKIFLFVRLF